MQEIKAHPGQLPQELSQPPDCYCYWNSAKRPGYSGVAVFSRQKAEHIRTGLGIEEFDREGRVLELDFGRFTLLIFLPWRWFAATGRISGYAEGKIIF